MGITRNNFQSAVIAGKIGSLIQLKPAQQSGDIMDISNYTLPELRRLQAKVEIEIRRRSDSVRRNLIKRVQKMAADEGLTMDDLLDSPPQAIETKPEAPKRGRRPKAATGTQKAKPVSVIKYRNPANPDQGWSGRGRKPQWAIDLLAQGRSLDEVAV
jgi:DNA-binding protein H-NS